MQLAFKYQTELEISLTCCDSPVNWQSGDFRCVRGNNTYDERIVEKYEHGILLITYLKISSGWEIVQMRQSTCK